MTSDIMALSRTENSDQLFDRGRSKMTKGVNPSGPQNLNPNSSGPMVSKPSRRSGPRSVTYPNSYKALSEIVQMANVIVESIQISTKTSPAQLDRTMFDHDPNGVIRMTLQSDGPSLLLIIKTKNGKMNQEIRDKRSLKTAITAALTAYDDQAVETYFKRLLDLLKLSGIALPEHMNPPPPHIFSGQPSLDELDELYEREF